MSIIFNFLASTKLEYFYGRKEQGKPDKHIFSCRVKQSILFQAGPSFRTKHERPRILDIL